MSKNVNEDFEDFEAPSEVLNFQFCNSKSIELLGFDLTAASDEKRAQSDFKVADY